MYNDKIINAELEKRIEEEMKKLKNENVKEEAVKKVERTPKREPQHALQHEKSDQLSAYHRAPLQAIDMSLSDDYETMPEYF
jgi:hypothetical protein